MYTIKRFLGKVDRQPNGCWNWTGTRNSGKYGLAWIGRKRVRAHRLSWMLFCGSIPEGKMVLHTCNNRKCVNPDHLYIGDGSDNNIDRINDGYVHECPTHRKLYSGEVEVIRKLIRSRIPYRTIARLFKVHHSTVSRIKRDPHFPTRG